MDKAGIKKNPENMHELRRWGLFNEEVALGFQQEDHEFDFRSLFAEIRCFLLLINLALTRASTIAKDWVSLAPHQEDLAA